MLRGLMHLTGGQAAVLFVQRTINVPLGGRAWLSAPHPAGQGDAKGRTQTPLPELEFAASRDAAVRGRGLHVRAEGVARDMAMLPLCVGGSGFVQCVPGDICCHPSVAAAVVTARSRRGQVLSVGFDCGQIRQTRKMLLQGFLLEDGSAVQSDLFRTVIWGPCGPDFHCLRADRLSSCVRRHLLEWPSTPFQIRPRVSCRTRNGRSRVLQRVCVRDLDTGMDFLLNDTPVAVVLLL